MFATPPSSFASDPVPVRRSRLGSPVRRLPGDLPAMLGTYKPMAFLSSDASTEVYIGRATRSDAPSPWVALRVLHPRLARNPSALVRCTLGHKMALLAHHGAIPASLEAGCVGDWHWIAGEYVHGETLEDLLRAAARTGKGIAPALACGIVAVLADALRHGEAVASELESEYAVPAHRPQRYAHGSLTATSVLVTYDGLVKLLDFGVPAGGPDADDSLGMTIAGGLAYTPPEQFRGGQATPEGDVFRLGALLWELCTGQRLHADRSHYNLLVAVEQGLVPAPSECGVVLPAELEALLMRALAPAPEDRFATPGALADALAQVVRAFGWEVDARDLGDFVLDCFPLSRPSWTRREMSSSSVTQVRGTPSSSNHRVTTSALPGSPIHSPGFPSPRALPAHRPTSTV